MPFALFNLLCVIFHHPVRRNTLKNLKHCTRPESKQMGGSIALGHTVRRKPIVTNYPLIQNRLVARWRSVFFNLGGRLILEESVYHYIVLAF